MTIYRYTEGISDEDGKVAHIPQRMEVFSIKDLQKDCYKAGMPTAIFSGRGPWHICQSEKYPLMAFEIEEIMSVFQEPPISQNYIHLDKDDGKSLIYCKRLELLQKAEYFCCDPLLTKNISLQKYIYEGKVDDGMLMDDFTQENDYVKWRINCWKKFGILPQQYLTFGWGHSIHLLRLCRIHGFTQQQAFDFMYLYQIEKKKK